MKPLLVLVPHAGGAPTYYRDLLVTWRSVAECLPICRAGRGTRFGETPTVDRGVLIDEMLTAIAHAHRDGRQIVLLGHSLGALLAYEAALAMRTRWGREPDLLIVSGANGPGRLPRHPEAWGTDAELWEAVCSLGGIEPELAADADIARLVLPAVRADYQVADRTDWHDPPLLSCPVRVLWGQDDPLVSREGIAAWTAVTTGTCSSAGFPGGHFYLREFDGFSDHVVELLADLVSAKDIDNTDNRRPARV